MTIVFTHPYDDCELDYRTEQLQQPFTVPHLTPAPLSADVEEIVAYMLLIGDRPVLARR